MLSLDEESVNCVQYRDKRLIRKDHDLTDRDHPGRDEPHRFHEAGLHGVLGYAELGRVAYAVRHGALPSVANAGRLPANAFDAGVSGTALASLGI